jgi:hypothetical protein
MSKTNIKTIDKDKGWSNIVSEIGKIDQSFVQVGVQADAEPYPEGESVADVAYYNEFGTDTIPSRPFMRQTFDTKSAELSKRIQAQMGMILDGKQSVYHALAILGEWYQLQIQKEIVDGNWTPNAPSTLKIKEAKSNSDNKETDGEVHPLIDTGRLRQSIRYVVKMINK